MLSYIVVAIIGMYHHELFMEEAQQLTIARDSNSILDVYRNMLYEGHVTLWNSMLYLIAHYISPAPVFMQSFHLLTIACAVFIFVRYAPFNLTIKALTIFGCYFAFVYCIVSRNYALGILLLFACCALLANPAKNLAVIAILLALMCLTHLFYVFAAIGLFAYLLCRVYGKRELYPRMVLPAFIFLAGLTVALIQMKRMPADTLLHGPPGLTWLTAHNIGYAISCFERGFITLPPLHSRYFWDRQLVQALPLPFQVAFSAVLFLVTLGLISKSRKAIIFYLPPVAFLTIFFAASGVAGNRYFGMFFIFFLAALWLAYYDGVHIFSSKKSTAALRGAQIFIYALLANQLFTSVYMYYEDSQFPFSEAKATAAYLKTNGLCNQPFAVDGYNAGPPISAYLGQKVFYLDIDQFGSFCIWKQAYFPFPRPSLVTEISASGYLDSLPSFILITNRGKTVNDSAGFSFEKLASFEGALIEGEDYYVFRARRNK